ncbi:hypothetical protein F5J12DRAFT_783785 [Pisolithus orientalis]|uniref:uncharacterized protein n=1 Tax=Pisolithus orientalis TaxID=936130 RepID=UPI00222413A7|nr:uncharacterized protein F5J12DRAFT_783785 [Pisolithus orientalis]KAI6002614.1 hypothetical protein F5J12DRAFT_783785 [Pisolithus orientalis]
MSTHQASPHIPNTPSSFWKATTPKLQITSDDKEADIWAKMADHKWRKVLREEAAQLEAERLKREWVEAKKWEQEWLEAKRQEQGCLEAKCQEREAQAQPKTGELKGKAQEKGTGSCEQCEKGQVPCTFSCMQQSKCKKRTCDWCTEMKVRCELPEGVEPKVEEVGARSGKMQVLEDVTSPRAREKKKVTCTRSGVPSELEASPLGVGVAAATPTDPLVAAVAKGFELITVAMDHQILEMRAGRETQCQFNSQLGDLLGEFKFILHLTSLASKCSKELHLDVVDLELESLWSD